MSAVLSFFKDNPVFDILLLLGLLAMYITYIGAPRASKKSGKYVSGIPGTGGILIAVGFLTTDHKWLAFLGLLEPGLIYLLFSIITAIPSLMKERKAIRNWTPPEELEGGRVVEYSSYNKEYEMLREEIGEDHAMICYYIVRYIITESADGFKLYGQEQNRNIHLITTAETPGSCKKRASAKAKWESAVSDR